MNRCIKSRLPKWRGRCKRSSCTPPQNHNNTASSCSTSQSPSMMSSPSRLAAAAQLLGSCQRRSIRSSRYELSSLATHECAVTHHINGAALNGLHGSGLTAAPAPAFLPPAFAHSAPPLPPPLPSPAYSFRKRVLPPNLLAFDSPRGRKRFLHALTSRHAEAYFPLSQQFLNQMDPAYCGISTLILVLNALAMDPNVRWRGGWRWYGDESMLLDRCCLEAERVAREGITMDQFCGLARCHGVGPVMKRPSLPPPEGPRRAEDAGRALPQGAYSVDEFRRDVINAVRHPPRTDWDDSAEDEDDAEHDARPPPQQQQPLSREEAGGYFLTTSFDRNALQQTGDGHFSPIAAYHPPTDSCLVLDVARFKYAPYWVDVTELYEAMRPADKSTGKARGWILMYPPPPSSSATFGSHGGGGCGGGGGGGEGGGRHAHASRHESQHPRRHTATAKKRRVRSIEEREGKRPAACTPLAGSGEPICPVEKIKVNFCAVQRM